MFDLEHGIALQAMQGNQASSRGKGEVSWFFSSFGVNLGYFLELRQGVEPLELVFVKRHQNSCLLMRDTSGISSRLGRAVWMLLEVRRETLSRCHNDIWIPINLQDE